MKEKSSRVRPDEAEAIELGRRISDVVTSISQLKGITQTALAKELGYSRASFCQILHTKSLSRQWKLSTLCGVARVFGIPMSEIIKAAETGTEPPSLTRKLRLAEIAKEKNEMLKELARLRREEEAASKAQGKLLNHWVELGHEEDRLQDEEDRLNPKKEEEECDE